MRPPGPVLSEEDRRVDSKHISILCMRLPGLVLSEEDCRIGSKHLSILSVSLLRNSHFMALHGAGERIRCTCYRRARCNVDVLLRMTDFEFYGNTGSLDVDTLAAATVVVQSAGNNAQAVSAGSK